MRLCRSSHADMNGLTYSAANLARLVWRSCSRSCDHVQSAHSPIVTGISHCIADSCCHASRSGCLFRTGNRPSKGGAGSFETHGGDAMIFVFFLRAGIEAAVYSHGEVARANLVASLSHPPAPRRS